MIVTYKVVNPIFDFLVDNQLDRYVTLSQMKGKVYIILEL